MKRFFRYPLALTALVLFSALFFSHEAAAQSVNAASAGPPVDVQKIISTLTAKETEFRRALNNYAFKRDAVIQVIGMGGQIAGEYHRVSHFTFDSQGNRYEKIVFFPMPTYPGVTPEDIEDLSGVNPFALEAHNIGRYNFAYVGRERIDELDLYVFDVTPKVIPNPKTKERLFTGRIWVDDHDLQIVKSRGKGVPETKNNKFAVVETYREQVDGRYWFPTYSYADEELVFDDGNVLHIRIRVTYKDYEQGHVDIKITDADDGGEIDDATTQKPTTTPLTKSEIRGASLNSKAIELPKPAYPETAKRAGIHGTVKVSVTVDERGHVSEAEAIEGPKELREAAVEAARRARFEPPRVHGAPIKIDGVLTYEF
ncbi:MAG TPA: TonB family protein [Pyrinomonadaceae bacterium]|nr:TonB family protein [Pyrinomonadaceae bacterium]